MPQTFRLCFSKTGDAKFISHLDTNRCFTRAIRRSGAGVWYTEGFNRRLYLLFALPLPLGFDSHAESVDIKLHDISEGFELSERINGFLPCGIEVFNGFIPKNAPRDIEGARYRIDIADSDEYLADLKRAYDAVNRLDEILIEKTGKRRTYTANIKSQIHSIDIERTDDRIVMNMSLDAGSEKNLNPMTFLQYIFERLPREPALCSVTRTGILTANGAGYA